MTPPKPVKCHVPGCKYKTPKGCPTWELMFKDRDDHISYSHPKAADNSDAQNVVDQIHVQTEQQNVREYPKITFPNPDHQTVARASSTVNLMTQTPSKEDNSQLSASCSPMTNLLKDCGILPAEMSSSNSLPASTTSNRELIENPETKEQIAKGVRDDGQWSQLQFTAYVAKSTEAGTKWRCSVGCRCGRNTDFWVSKQGVKKHIAKEHPDPRVSYFWCKLCYGQKRKRKLFDSCDQVLEHFRLKHKTPGVMPSMEKQCDSILACHSEDQTHHRVQKRSNETWFVELGSTVALQGGIAQNKVAFTYTVSLDIGTSEVVVPVEVLESGQSCNTVLQGDLTGPSSQHEAPSEQPPVKGCDSQESLVICIQEPEPSVMPPVSAASSPQLLSQVCFVQF